MRYAASEARAAGGGALFMHAFDQPEVVAGAGTIGIELDEQAPGASTVIVAVGGGGLIAGIAAWFAGRVRVVGVEPDGCPTLHAALAAGAPVDVEVGGIAADGLGAGRAGTIAFGIAQRFVDRVVLVDDDAIRDAQSRLWAQTRIVAEPGAAAALAGLTAGAYIAGPDEHVVVVVCGANADPGLRPLTAMRLRLPHLGESVDAGAAVSAIDVVDHDRARIGAVARPQLPAVALVTRREDGCTTEAGDPVRVRVRRLRVDVLHQHCAGLRPVALP